MRLDAYFRNEIAAGAIASILSLPVCVAAGVLAFSPLGPAYAALGATAGLLGAIAAGGISTMLEIRALEKIRMDSAVGMALYKNRLR